MKRKVLSVILTGAMVAGLAGTVTVHAEEQKTYNIGICQLVQHEALDAATQGFEDAVKEGLGEENVTFDEQNAQGDSATCSTIINNFVSSNVDLILQMLLLLFRQLLPEQAISRFLELQLQSMA